MLDARFSRGQHDRCRAETCRSAVGPARQAGRFGHDQVLPWRSAMPRNRRIPLTRLVIGLLLGGTAATGCATAGSVSDGSVVRWVDKTVAERQATAEDKRFDEIGWVTDIRTAIRLGTEYNRPIFLYTGD